MKKICVILPIEIYDVVKSNADLEHRSVLNYLGVVLENIFRDGEIIKASVIEGLNHCSPGKNTWIFLNEDIHEKIKTNTKLDHRAVKNYLALILCELFFKHKNVKSEHANEIFFVKPIEEKNKEDEYEYEIF